MDNIKTDNMEVTGLDELAKKLDRLQAHDPQPTPGASFFPAPPDFPKSHSTLLI